MQQPENQPAEIEIALWQYSGTKATGTDGCSRFHRMNGIAHRPTDLIGMGLPLSPAGISCGG
jgi:hypothetical protein